MKLVLALMLCAVVAAAPKTHQLSPFERYASEVESPESRNIALNLLLRQLFEYLRRLINNGSDLFGPLDPLQLDHFHLSLPAGLINLDLELKDIYATGLGGFVVHRNHMDLRDLTLEVDISVPQLDISTQHYDLVGDLINAIPLYGKGKAQFIVKGFRFQLLAFLKQSEDENSVIIERIENLSFQIPTLESSITGAIGGGDEIDAIVNAMAEDVILDYINRFQGAISLLIAPLIASGLNPILEQLDSWRLLAPLLPRN